MAKAALTRLRTETRKKHRRRAKEIYDDIFEIVCIIINHKNTTYERELAAAVATFRPLNILVGFKGVFACNKDTNARPAIFNVINHGSENGHWWARGFTGNFCSLKSGIQSEDTTDCGQHAVTFLIMDEIAPYHAMLYNNTKSPPKCRT